MIDSTILFLAKSAALVAVAFTVIYLTRGPVR